jgi:hypothetical protein
MPHYIANNVTTNVHHIIPTHMTMGAANNHPDNLVELPIIEHAEAHYELWLICGHREDELAYLGLSGQINGAEAHREATRAAMQRPEVQFKLRNNNPMKRPGANNPMKRKEIAAKFAGDENPMRNPEVAARNGEAQRQRNLRKISGNTSVLKAIRY